MSDQAGQEGKSRKISPGFCNTLWTEIFTIFPRARRLCRPHRRPVAVTRLKASPPGQVYTLEVNAVGSYGPSDWSDPSTAMGGVVRKGNVSLKGIFLSVRPRRSAGFPAVSFF